MGLPRTFVGFSSTDIHYYRLMLAWKEHEHIDFNFANCQLEKEINSDNEAYIKGKCRERIQLAGTFAVLIGQDTRSKHKYVRWEMEVAIEKKCRIIGINLDGSRRVVDATCPPIIRNIGAIFVPFSPKIVAYALADFKMKESGDWYYEDAVYKKLGY
ncbi:hypothetical protein GGQ86_001377 [Xanthobacter flavus]|uniref:Molecular chaperone Tir n=1 Tax=Xanthobacter flavus TaxID=281 RepID=A0A9W6CFP3_XANFL|nr:TIR domain-containing protein [Xanthobacter flavus]MDR6332913.1 hypothetical protein [Xanthobacter flavus]GLI21191.1 molecular chaperone Tir [Xanthobacter flavus]